MGTRADELKAEVGEAERLDDYRPMMALALVEILEVLELILDHLRSTPYRLREIKEGIDSLRSMPR
jgi:hypothetical protein